MKPFSNEMQKRLKELRKDLTNPQIYNIGLFRYFEDRRYRLYAGQIEFDKKTIVGAVRSKFEGNIIEQMVMGSGIYTKELPQLNFIIEDDISVAAKFSKRRSNESALISPYSVYMGKWHDVKNISNEGEATVALFDSKLDMRYAQIVAEL